MDDEWHTWQAAPLAWYRVWKKKMVQRVTFESQTEEEIVFPLLAALEPLPDVSGAAGFREELWITIDDDRFALHLPLGYQFTDDAKALVFSQALGQYQVATSAKQNLVYAVVPVEQFDRDSIIIAQILAQAARLFFQALTTASTPSQMRGAAEVFSKHVEAALEDGQEL
jgi:hypothetical protein